MSFGLYAPPEMPPVSLSPARLQSGAVVLVALGVQEYIGLEPGVHLRWSIDPRHGVPALGFDIFRRSHVDGAPRSVDFAAERHGSLPREARFGATVWSNPGGSTASIDSEPTDRGTVHVLLPGGGVTTCRLDASEVPARRIELDVVHWFPESEPRQLEVWGTGGGRRVSPGRPAGLPSTRRGEILLGPQNLGRVFTVVIAGDALDGFQLGPLNAPYGVVAIRWVPVAQDAGWGFRAPLNGARIGLPITAPGYQVRHAYSPDAGAGAEDWNAAADRLSPDGSHLHLPVDLAQRFGPPTFAETRDLLRRALARQRIVAAGGAGRPRLTLDPVRLLLLAATDWRVARMLGLAMLDRTAAAGERYDYKVVAYFVETVVEDDCAPIPHGGATIEAGERLIVHTLTDHIPMAVAAADAETTPRTLRLGRGVKVPRDLQVAGLPGVVLEGEGRAAPKGRALWVTFADAAEQVRVVAAAAGREPAGVLGLSGDTVVSAQTIPAGRTREVVMKAAGLTGIVVAGPHVRIDRVCRARRTQRVVAHEWISFDVGIAPVPTLEAPTHLAASTVPAIARRGGAEQAIGVFVERRSQSLPLNGWLPLARRPLDPIAYDVARRQLGAQAAETPEAGPWRDLGQPILISDRRPPVHHTPEGWPVDIPHLVDDALDPGIRYYGYRARGRDIFGRTSAWSPMIVVDAADRIGPPGPASLRARWLEPDDPTLSADEDALLAGGVPRVRVQWSWPATRRAQAPDAQIFRVYWNPAPFTALPGVVTRVASSATGPTVTLTSPRLMRVPPIDAFAGEWLRQGSRQHRVRASTASLPVTLSLEDGMDPPREGPCSISLRPAGPDPLLEPGNPLRIDPARPEVWERRVLQGPLVTVAARVRRREAGVVVMIVTVTADDPRAGTAIVGLAADWRWGDVEPAGLELETGGVTYPVIGGTLGRIAILLLDTTAHAAPALGGGVVRAADGSLGTLVTDQAILVDPAPLALVGGTVELSAMAPAGPLVGPRPVAAIGGGPVTAQVIAHRLAATLEIVVASTALAAQINWFPDHEATMDRLILPVDPDTPTATGMVGVSATDGRPWTVDRRQVPGEPTAAGNEGPIIAAAVLRQYRGRPGPGPAPDGAAGIAPLWAPPPEPFSGMSRYPLRWLPGGARRFLVFHATLDAVLDAEQADRAARRGNYAGAPPVGAAELRGWRAEQAALDAASLQTMATRQPGAFVPLTPTPLAAPDPLLVDPDRPGGLRWVVSLDGRAPGRHFLRIAVVDAAGNVGDAGQPTLPIMVPDTRRPAPPLCRRPIEGDREVWVRWDDAAGEVSEYWVYRSRALRGSQPDVRDMTRVATAPPDRFPEPLAVSAGSVRLPGAVPNAVVAVYRAEAYDPASPADGQAAAAIPGAFTIVGTIVGGLEGLADGTLVFVVIREAAAGPPVLASARTRKAWRDISAEAGNAYQYRVVAMRRAAVGPAETREVRSFPSDVVEAVPYDASRPAPPAAAAAWVPSAGVIRVTWGAAGLAADLDVRLERSVDGENHWVRASGWVAASTGRLDDARVRSGSAYVYRLRARRRSGRQSSDEPTIGPVAVP